MAQPSRKDQFRISLSVDGNDWGVWTTKSGGKIAGNGQTFKPGAMQPAIPLGGTPSVDNVVLTRNYDRVRDHDRLDQLTDRVGKARCVAKQRPLDDDGNAYGKSITWTGLLESVEAPDADANAVDSALLTIEILADATVSLQ